MEPGAGIEERSEERKAHQMVTMGVREEQREVKRSLLCFCPIVTTMGVIAASYQIVAKANDATSSIKNERVSTGLYLYARSIAPMTERVWSWRGIATSHTPETHQETLPMYHFFLPQPFQ